MKSVNEIIADSFRKHTLDLMKLSAHQRERVLLLLKNLERDLLAKLSASGIDGSKGLTAFQRKRLEDFLENTTETINQSYGNVNVVMSQTLLELADFESAFIVDSVNTTVKADLLVNTITREQAKVIADETLISKAPSQEWWKKQGDQLSNRFAETVRLGMMQGETMPQIVQRVRGGVRGDTVLPGVMQIAKRNAEALVRTSIMTVASEVRRNVYSDNGDVIKGIQQISTLDDRVSEICIAYAGAAWDLNYQPIGGNSLPYLEGVPRHWNCRSAEIPLLKTYAEILKRDVPEPPLGMRASMDGQIPADMSFDTWLRKKDEERPGFADDLMGQGKADLWREGKITLQDIVDSRGQPKSLEELRNEAGLPPEVQPAGETDEEKKQREAEELAKLREEEEKRFREFARKAQEERDRKATEEAAAEQAKIDALRAEQEALEAKQREEEEAKKAAELEKQRKIEEARAKAESGYTVEHAATLHDSVSVVFEETNKQYTTLQDDYAQLLDLRRAIVAGQSSEDINDVRQRLTQKYNELNVTHEKLTSLVTDTLRLPKKEQAESTRLAQPGKYVFTNGINKLPGKAVPRSMQKTFDDLHTFIAQRVTEATKTPEVVLEKNVRASYSEPSNRIRTRPPDSSKVISLRDQTTLFHESGHWLEDTSIIKGSKVLQENAIAFYKHRTKGEPLEKLSKLLNDPGFDDVEVARLDKFPDPYMGKDYSYAGLKSTELTSVCFGYLKSNPGVLVRDRELFIFTYCQLRGVKWEPEKTT